MNSDAQTISVPAPQDGFWRRQFSPEPTMRQAMFDVVFGIALPLICLVADPIVFRTGFSGPPYPFLERYAAGSYCVMLLCMAALTLWLLSRFMLPMLAGILFAGALMAFAVGIILLPISVVALTIGFGILGFTPWATGFVFLRNGFRAAVRLRAARSGYTTIPLVAAVCCITLLAPGSLQLYANREADKAVAVLLADDPKEHGAAVAKLAKLRPVVSLRAIVELYVETEDAALRSRLAAAYKGITGDNIENELPCSCI